MDQDAKMFCFSFYRGQIFAQDSVVIKTKFRAYPGSEFVVANTLAKLKKLEPNEINLSHGLVLYLTLSLLGVTFVVC